MRTELGRIAALSQRGGREPSPLEREVRRVAWLIAASRWPPASRSWRWASWPPACPLADALKFAIGLLVANVPEGSSRPSRSRWRCASAR